MDQLNNTLPSTEEEKQDAAAIMPISIESPLLNQVRQKFEITGSLSLIFGCLFTFSFYDAAFGINALFFTGLMIILLAVFMKRHTIPLKKETFAYYGAALLLSLSTTLTSNGSLQALNTIGTILLLNLSILHQLHEDGKWDFAMHFSKMVGMLFHGLGSIAMPFADAVYFMKRTKFFRHDKVRNVFLGILLSVPILWLVIVLLSGADMLFSSMTTKILQKFFSPDIIVIVLLVLFGFFSCYCILCGAAAQVGRKEKFDFKKGASAIAVTVMLLICMVYAVFCGVQIIYLFAAGVFALPEGITFSEYARSGFFQLLAVTIINVLLMVLCTTLFEESKLLRILLTFMTACTYIMIFSAGYRMLLYIDAYQLTFLRLFVLLALLIIALLLAGVIVSVYKKEFPLFRYCVAVITICYLCFSLSRPDYWIASYFTDRKAVLEEEDARFLMEELSLDAAPVVVPLLMEKDRWNSLMHQDDINNGNYFEQTDNYDHHVIKGEWSTLDYYSVLYYKKIQLQNKLRGYRDFNVSIQIADQYRKRNAITFYKN